ncbi:MAG TPA: NCS2 family permease [Tepidisphaeraceae bacterium]|jgi:AGZA family xanthine/uracil permease-like MFS transporter|nr:NCS2 family permease [Tepidisphaeraceae bacterium]
MNAIARFFEFEQRQTTLAREMRGGVTTFLTMAYIIAVNPLILANAGISVTAAATSTALAAGVCCIAMGLFANFPIALASGMGLNAMVAFQITAATGSWQAAMGLVVLDGLLILLLVLVGLREAVLRAIPRELRIAIGAGIGLFIAVIGLQGAKIIVASPVTMVTAGSFQNRETLIASVGLIVTAVLMIRKVTGALLLGILLATTLALWLGVTSLPDRFPRPDFSAMFQADVPAVLQWRYLPLLLSIVMIDFFDTLGTASAVAEQGRLADGDGNIPRVRRLLIVDSAAASLGGAMGASSNTSFIESAAGVAEGARTGLHSVIVGLLFLLAAIVAPLATVVPASATAPALILVGFLMMSQVAEIDFKRLENAVPAFITILTIPLTFSIAHGIGYGFVAYVVLNLLTGHFRRVHPLMYVVAAAFVAYFAAGY